MGKFGEEGLVVDSSKDAFQKVFDVDVGGASNAPYVGEGSAPADPAADMTAGAAKGGLSTTIYILIGSLVGVAVLAIIIALIWKCRKAGASKPPGNNDGVIECPPLFGPGIGGTNLLMKLSDNKITIEAAGEFTKENADALQKILDGFLESGSAPGADEIKNMDMLNFTKDNVKLNGNPVADNSPVPAAITKFVQTFKNKGNTLVQAADAMTALYLAVNSQVPQLV